MSEENVRKAVKKKFDSGGSYPLQTAGTVAIGSSSTPVIRGQHEVLLGGGTGIVATQFGLHSHGVTVGRIGTGIYGISFPNTAHVRINPYVAVPTGFACDVSVGGLTGQGRIVGATGFAFLYTKAPAGSTGVMLPCAPVTGTVVTLDFEFSAKHQHDGTTLVPY